MGELFMNDFLKKVIRVAELNKESGTSTKFVTVSDGPEYTRNRSVAINVKDISTMYAVGKELRERYRVENGERTPCCGTPYMTYRTEYRTRIIYYLKITMNTSVSYIFYYKTKIEAESVIDFLTNFR